MVQLSLPQNSKIDKIYNNAKNLGAIGGKLLGAGAGGHFLLLSEFEKKQKIEKKMMQLGCQIIPFSFEYNGVSSWRINEKGDVEI